MAAVSAQDIKGLGTILSVWAHPDDETLTAAGIMTLAAQNGQKVVCVTATRGELGTAHLDQPMTPQDLAATRTAELANALSILGVKDHYFLDYPDGGCQNVPIGSAVENLKGLIKQHQPDTILTFGPEGLTGHPDHQTVSRWVGAAAKDTGVTVYHAVVPRDVYAQMAQLDQQFNLFFNLDQPPLVEPGDCDIFLQLDDDLVAKKFDCLKGMPSQYSKWLTAFSREAICEMLSTEAFIRSK